MQYFFEKLFKKFLAFICFLTIFGSLIYYFYKFNWLGIIISLILTLAGFIILIFFDNKNQKNNKIIKKTIYCDPADTKIYFLNYIFSGAYLITFLFCFTLLLNYRTTDSIISPWQVVPLYFFIAYFFATIILILNIINNKKLNLLLISLHYFLSFSVALIIYKFGYGYDSFVHQATLNLIDKTGQVLPKTFYYLGQYSLEIIFHKIFFIPLVWLDKFLVPLLAALFIPVAIFKTLGRWFSDEKQKKLTILFLLILPFTIFIVTTPQNLAYLFLILLIIHSLDCKNIHDIIFIYLLAISIFVTQPIAGIPALLFALIINIFYSDFKKIKKYLYGLVYFITAISLPIAFYILEKGQRLISSTANSDNGETIKNTAKGIKDILTWFYFNNPAQENVILNLIYLYIFNLKSILLILLAVGSVIILKNRKECGIIFLYILMSLALFVSYLLASFLPFQFLIFYERDNYINRILLISILFLLPVFLVTIYAVINRIIKQNIFIKLTFLIFFSSLITIALYASYPRYDRYFNSRGFSTGKNDIEAVHWIKDNADKDYIVLANQQVSAAALREFGFNKYFKNDIFYYPVPTGGPLYNYYLDMVYKKPAKETMQKALNLVGVNEGYFVLNKYWWAFPKILDEAKLEADSWKEIGNGDIFIFKYNN